MSVITDGNKSTVPLDLLSLFMKCLNSMYCLCPQILMSCSTSCLFLVRDIIFLCFSERQKRVTVSGTEQGTEQKKDEENWHLRDVIFLEDTRTVPVGRVLKVDGAYAAVKFPSTRDRDNKETDDILQDCRLMKKDDLQVCPDILFKHMSVLLLLCFIFILNYNLKTFQSDYVYIKYKFCGVSRLIFVKYKN